MKTIPYQFFIFNLSLNIPLVTASTSPSGELSGSQSHIKCLKLGHSNNSATIDWAPVPVPDKVLTQYNLLYTPSTLNAYPAFPSPRQAEKSINICQTTTDSPLASDVQFLIEYLGKDRWNWYCHQTYDQVPYCTMLACHGTAAVGVCGAYRSSMLCEGVEKAVSGVFEDCKRKINDDVRVGGIAVILGAHGSITPNFRGLVVYHT